MTLEKYKYIPLAFALCHVIENLKTAAAGVRGNFAWKSFKQIYDVC